MCTSYNSWDGKGEREKSPKDRVVGPLPNGLKGLQMGGYYLLYLGWYRYKLLTTLPHPPKISIFIIYAYLAGKSPDLY